jgi:hypothetical protein
MSKEKRIQHQKNVALAVMRVLTYFDTQVILAGGAPRDWYLGNPAKDLDFYFHTPEKLNSADISDIVSSIVGNVVLSESEIPDGYNDNPEIFMVYDGVLCLEIGDVMEEIQLMQMKSPIVPASLVDNFSVSLSKIWVSSDGITHFFPEFQDSIENKTMYIYTNHEKYLERMGGKFPDYKFVFTTSI